MPAHDLNPMRPSSAREARPECSGSRVEAELRGWLQLGAALTGAWLVLLLQDETGAGHRMGSDPGGETFESPGSIQGLETIHGFQIIESFTLVDDRHQACGRLYVLSTVPLELSEAQRRGLRFLADHIQVLVTPEGPRPGDLREAQPPDGASLVPGLVRELGGFTFGISASLDAFEARFSSLEEARKYGTNIRKSLNWMNAFIGELRDYGIPRKAICSEFELEPVLQSLLADRRSFADKQCVGLRLEVDGSLPRIRANEDDLRSVFTRILDLALRHQEPGGQVLLRVDPNHPDWVSGYVDFLSSRFKEVDPSRLFEPFYFLDSGLARLRLPGAQRMLENLGGRLTAGPGPAGGTRIHFMLPTNLPRIGHPSPQP